MKRALILPKNLNQINYKTILNPNYKLNNKKYYFIVEILPGILKESKMDTKLVAFSMNEVDDKDEFGIEYNKYEVKSS